LIKAEFHCHSNYSPDSLVKLEEIIRTCRSRDIGKIAITDHGCMAGALKAHQMAPDLVVVSEEILTNEGEILAYFMTEEIPDHLPPLDVVKRLKDQGAFISIAHPYDPYRGSSWKPGTLEELVPFLDGIEAFNARCIDQSFNEKAGAFADEHGLAWMVGSDAHTVPEIGRAVLQLPDFNSADELRQVVKTASFSGELSNKIVHLQSTVAKVINQFRRR
jgi:predicted metal-dependent phosphoesterase TrpH